MFVNPEMQTIDTLLSFAPQISLCLKLLNKLSLTKFLPQTAFLISASTPESSSRHLILSSHESWTRLRISTWSWDSRLWANFIFWSELRFAEQTLIELKSIATAISQVLKLINEGNFNFSNHHNLPPDMSQTDVLDRSCDPNIETIDIQDHLWWWQDGAEHNESTRRYSKSNEMLGIGIK